MVALIVEHLVQLVGLSEARPRRVDAVRMGVKDVHAQLEVMIMFVYNTGK